MKKTGANRNEFKNDPKKLNPIDTNANGEQIPHSQDNVTLRKIFLKKMDLIAHFLVDFL